MAGASMKLSGPAREAAVAALLDQHPEAWVAALTETGLVTAMPSAVPVGSHHVIEGNESMLEIVVPPDQRVVIEAWNRMFEQGSGSAAIHLLGEPDRTLGIHFFDCLDVYGVMLQIVIGLAADDDLQRDRPELVPRTAVIRKDQQAVITVVDQAITAILGWSAGELVGERTLDLIHPDDQKLAIAAFIELLGRPGSSSRTRQRYRHRDGSWRWMEVTNHNYLNQADDPHVLADMVDVQDEVTAQEALYERSQLLRRLTEALPVGVLHIGPDRAVTYRNDRLAAIVGSAPDRVDDLLARIEPPDRATLAEAVDAALIRGEDVDVEVSFRRPAVRPCHAVLSLRPLTSQIGSITGAVACVLDVTEETSLREELQQRVRYDPLTGCLNHGSILAELQQRLEQPDNGTWTVAAFIDLDDFKGINDRYGHLAGDQLLKHVATRLQHAAGDDGQVGRLGGDEFLVILTTDPSPRAITGIGGRIVAALDRAVLLAGQRTIPRASVGVTYAVPSRPDTVEALIARADAAMYASKSRGDGSPVVTHPDVAVQIARPVRPGGSAPGSVAAP